MKISYASSKVEKYFNDFGKMKKILPFEWVKTIKKHINNIEASDNFSIFLSLGLGRPEQLSGYQRPTYSLKVSANARMIIEVLADQSEIMICDEIKVEGVCDYHGDKENWYIP